MFCLLWGLFISFDMLNIWIPEVIFSLSAYAFFVGLLWLGKKRLTKKYVSSHEKEKLDVLDVTVLVPFRNEVDRIGPLLLSLRNSGFEGKVIFINDHSEDETVEAIRLDQKENWTILHLGESEFGKKSAIFKGVKSATSKYILTLDADCVIGERYFEALQSLAEKDVWILPVEMTVEEDCVPFFAWEYQLQSEGSKGFAGWTRPITASGANLFFTREFFLKVQQYRSDTSILSGDDQFLLQSARKMQAKIGLSTDDDLIVSTPCATKIKEGMSQRWRWLAKSKYVSDPVANVFGAVILLIQLGYYVVLFKLLVFDSPFAALLLLVMKADMDAFITTWRYQRRFKTLQMWWYELLYPFYILYLLLGLVLVEPKWKGRNTKKPSNK